MPTVQRVTPFLWFDDQAEEAVAFYLSVFDNSRIIHVSCYGEVGQKVHGRPAGSVMTIEFELDGQRFIALNGGPVFSFNQAISFQIACCDQAECDRYWERLSVGGDERAQQCGWLKDRFGVSWQVVPAVVARLLGGPDAERAGQAMAALLRMKKIDIAALEQAYDE